VREILKTNNPVELSFVRAVLTDAGIRSFVLDENMSVLDGSMVILPRRLMVDDADETAARKLVNDALTSTSPFA